MGFYFRRSKKLLPGVRVNLTAKGLGVSIGGKGIHVSQSATGKQTFSAGLPGTGLRYRKTLPHDSLGSMNEVEADSTKDNSPMVNPERKDQDIQFNDQNNEGALVTVNETVKKRPRRRRNPFTGEIYDVVEEENQSKVISASKESKKSRTNPLKASERSELLADLNRSLEIKEKINNPPAGLHFEGMKLEKGEFGFYKSNAAFIDPRHADNREDIGTVWITSRRIRYVSLRTTKVWDFDRVESVQSNDTDDLYIFSMKDQMKNYGFVVESDTPAFLDYFISAFTYHTPEYLAEDLNARLDRNIKEVKDKLGDY
jgi:hypothetical protein